MCLLEAPGDARWMQELAREMNLSETAFLFDRGEEFDLRWFTPAVEVDLCGHATLAAAHVLWETGRLAQDETARFRSRSGRLTARRVGVRIELDFPADPPSPARAPSGLAAALGAEPARLLRGTSDYLVEVDAEPSVRGLSPDFSALRSVPAQGVIVTARSEGGEYDFVSRYFAPSVGIDEDPVTGAAHCVLAPYWCERLGRDELVGYQASARGGTVGVRCTGRRVLLRGRAVTVLRGRLLAGIEEAP